MTIQQLSMTDAAFLYGETNGMPMHIAAVQVFDVPVAKRANYFSALKQHYARHLHCVPFLTRRASAMPLGLDHPMWETCAVDVDYHIQCLRLPAPGSQLQLETLIAELHALPLDRNRPLWRYYLIEGLHEGPAGATDDELFVFYTKMHHSAVDGMAGQAVLELMYSDSPELDVPAASDTVASDAVASDAVAADAVAAADDTNLDERADQLERMHHVLREFVLQPFRQVARMREQLAAMRRLSNHIARGRDLGAYAQSAPASPINVAVGAERSFAVGTLPLREMSAFGKRHNAKLNDVFMAVCAGALREHLLATDSLPAAPMLAGVPVSLRAHGDQSMNNQVTMMLCSLATDVADPLARLAAIRDSAMVAKKVVSMTRDLLNSDMHLPGLPSLMSMLANASMLLPAGMPVPSFCNLVLSNVPGPRQTKYLNGARMLTHYPVSIAAHGQAVNITVQSYEDRVDFAVTACRRALPDAVGLRDRVLGAWQALLHCPDRSAAACTAPPCTASTAAAVAHGHMLAA